MKKINALLLCAVFCLSLLAGCGAPGDGGQGQPSTGGDDLRDVNVVLDW